MQIFNNKYPSADSPTLEYKTLTADDSIPLWKRIQMVFPDEPDWESLDEDVLVRLVEEFEWEQSCATSAIIYLRSKNPAECQRLANWLLHQHAADQWLKAAALSALDGS